MDVEKAARVVLRILKDHRTPLSKPRLFKAFYFAHLYFARDEGGDLSDWPIIHLPNGPGIDSFDLLLHSAGRRIVKGDAVCGPYKTLEFSAAAGEEIKLSPSELAAIRSAVEFVAGKSAAELSEITHDMSNAWKLARDGEEMEIHLDLFSEEELEAKKRSFRDLEQTVGHVFQ